MLTNDQLSLWDRENFFHPSTHLAQFARGEVPNRIITTGEGVYITDRDGNKLLDAFAGLYCVNVGYGRQEIGEGTRLLSFLCRPWYRGLHYAVENDHGPCAG